MGNMLGISIDLNAFVSLTVQAKELSILRLFSH